MMILSSCHFNFSFNYISDAKCINSQILSNINLKVKLIVPNQTNVNNSLENKRAIVKYNLNSTTGMIQIFADNKTMERHHN